MLPHFFRVVLLCGLLCVSQLAWAQRGRTRSEGGKRKPDLVNEHYGPHQRHVLDLWKAQADKPTPLVVYIHGGGFHAGSKETIPGDLLTSLLDRGISVMAINYRFSPEVTMPAHYLDCARAIQFARQQAADWNIDPRRIGATGGSAGAGTSLWIGFHDDLAKRDSDDPVLRQSTRLQCMAVFGAQSTYDPRQIREWVGDAAARHPALQGFYGLKQDELETPAAYEKYKQASPLTHLTRDDPPVYAFYNEPRGPLPENAVAGQGIHHINFGIKLQERMDPLGIPCTIRHADEGKNVVEEVTEFFVEYLRDK